MLSDRQKSILLALIVILSVGGTSFVLAEDLLSSFYSTKGDIHWKTDNGCEVITTKDYSVRSGNPFTASSFNLSTESNGDLNISTSGSCSVTVDEINGTWTNASSISVGAGNNLTLNPGDKNEIKVNDTVDSIKFKTMSVNDSDVDFRYTASDEAKIVVNTTNATDGETYGLVDPDTEEGLDVAEADSDGVIVFDEVPKRTSEQKVRIEALGTLTIRNETSPHGKVTTATATIRFFEKDDEDDPTIVERTTSNGEIDLTGLPIDEQFAVTIKADGYYNRTVIIDDLSQQEVAFILSEDRPGIEQTFQVTDRTGDFNPENSEIVIQKAINRSEFGGSPSGFAWVNIAGDDLGANEQFTIVLEEADRYRIRVENDDGDTRILGAHSPENTGTVQLNIGNVVIDPPGVDTVGWDASRLNKSGQSVKVKFEYNDSTDNTTKIHLEIFEYQNESNELLSNTTFDGPFGNFSNTQNVPDADNDTTWVVKFTAERESSKDIQGKMIVGPQGTFEPGLAQWMVTVIFVGALFGTAGLFSQRNAALGGLVVAGMGAMFWWVGFHPPGLGGGVVALALAVAGIMFIRENRGGGL